MNRAWLHDRFMAKHMWETVKRRGEVANFTQFLDEVHRNNILSVGRLWRGCGLMHTVPNKFSAYGTQCSKCGSTNNAGQPCSSPPTPHAHPQETGAPAAIISETMVVSKRQIAIPGPAWGITIEESTTKLLGGRATSIRTVSSNKSHYKTRIARSCMHQKVFWDNSIRKWD